MADYPSRLKMFKAWAKAMEEGAVVGTPMYPKGSSPSGKTQSGRRKRPRRRRFTRRRRAKKVD